MSIIAILFIAVGTLVATLCATADGAVLSLDPDDRLPPAIAELRSRRERIHRALAFARVLGQLGAGVGVGLLLYALPAAGWLIALVLIFTAFLLVGLSESIARSVGDTRSIEIASRLSRFIATIETALSPVVLLGEGIDRGLNSLLPAHL